MEQRGTLKVLTNAFKIKNDPFAVDENGRPIRILKIWPGGMMRGILGASASVVLQEAGLGNVAIAHGVVSAGGPTALALSLGLAHLTVPMYEQLEERQIIAVSRGRLVFDLDSLMDELGPLFDDAAIGQLQEEIFAIVTNPDTGDHDLIDVKLASPGSRAALAASMAMPNFYPPVEVNGFKWCDGAWADLRIAIARLVQKFQPTDVMVFVNMPRYPDWSEKLCTQFGNMWSRPVSLALQKRTLSMDDDMEKALDWLMSLSNVRTYMIRPVRTNGFYPWTTSPTILRDKAQQVRSFMEGQLEDAYSAP